MVEGVEHLRAELQAVPLLESPVLYYGEIHVAGGLASDTPTTQAAKLSDTRQGECCLVEV